MTTTVHHLPVFQASPICAPCGGSCCTSCPGSTSPLDWGGPDAATMRERLTAAFATGRWAIDRWYGEYRHEVEGLRDDVLYVRPAEKGSESSSYVFDELEPEDDGDMFSRMVARIYPPSHPCTFHSAALGCELAFEARPIECRALEPVARPGVCVPHAGAKQERAIEWLPYQDMLREFRGW